MTVPSRIALGLVAASALGACGGEGAAGLEARDGGGEADAAVCVDTAVTDDALDGAPAVDADRDSPIAVDTGGDATPPPTCDRAPFSAGSTNRATSKRALLSSAAAGRRADSSTVPRARRAGRPTSLGVTLRRSAAPFV